MVNLTQKFYWLFGEILQVKKRVFQRKLKNIFVKEDKFINKLARCVFFNLEIFYRFLVFLIAKFWLTFLLLVGHHKRAYFFLQLFFCF